MTPVYISLMLTKNIAAARIVNIVLDFVLRDSRAPICAPIVAPMPIHIAGSQTTWLSMTCDTTPTNDEHARTNCDVAVAICTGKPRR